MRAGNNNNVSDRRLSSYYSSPCLGRAVRVHAYMSIPARRDMLFSVLFVGDEHLLRHLVWTSAQRLGADWAWEGAGVQGASLVRLRVMFFLLLDRDAALKDKVLEGWPEWCIAGVERGKATGFFRNLGPEVIEPWLVDERRCEDDFLSSCIDLYLVM